MNQQNSHELFREIKVRNQLAECILWHPEDRALWWTDIHSKKIYRSPWPFDSFECWPTPERLCSFGLTQNPEKIIAAFESGFAFYFPRTQKLEWISRPEINHTGTRFNDGRVDRDGKFWAGTLVEMPNATDHQGQAAVASIYCLTGNQCEKKISGLKITNSLCWSLDGKTLFYADSPTQKIRRVELHKMDEDHTTHIITESHAYPDGSIIDAENHLWNAEWLGARAVRYSPDGKKVAEICVPAKQSACLCFAGPNLDYLCISTGTENYTAEELAAEPSGGNIFVFKTHFKGLPEPYFKEPEPYFKETEMSR